MSDNARTPKGSVPFAGYDLIGDVHGCGDSLVALLTKLGYTRRRGVFQFHNSKKPRQAVFLGDILDRGPKIRESIHIIRDMVEKGSARIIMGNHEYNALAYTTRAPAGSGKTYLREHTPNHVRLIHETLEQFANHPLDWKDTLAWFYEWPLLLEFEHFRVIHACWDQALVEQFLQRCPDACINEQFVIDADDYKHPAGRFISRATRGVSLLLPDKLTITASDGYTRRTFRVKYWVDNPQTFGDVHFQPDPLPNKLACRPLSDTEKAYIPYYSPDQRPLFIGHYWQSGKPEPLAANIACLDYSAVKNGRLMAYRMNNEQTLSANNFVWVNGHETLVL